MRADVAAERRTNRIVIAAALVLVPAVVAVVIYAFVATASHQAACNPVVPPDHPPRGQHKLDC
jgi:hypothetical protein